MRVVGRLKQDRWTSPEGQTRSKVLIVAEHVEFKPQLKKDGDGKDDEAGAAAEGKTAPASRPRRRPSSRRRRASECPRDDGVRAMLQTSYLMF